MSERAKIRAQLRAVLRTDDAVDEFLVDYFSDIAAKRSASMTRDQKITLLIETKEVEDIKVALQKFNGLVGLIDNTNQKSLGSGAEEIVKLRQENDQLRHMIQELEQQLAHKTPDTLCVSRDGLDHVLAHCKKLDEYLHPQSVIEESDWVRWTYESLHTLEKYFGKYHRITSSFRFVSMIEKSGPKDTYKGLLDAAANIMTREVESSEKAARELERWDRSNRYESIS